MPTNVPIGFDAWVANNGNRYIAPSFQLWNVENLLPGLVNNPKYDCWEKDHSEDSKYGCFTGTTDPSNYSTSIIGNASAAWIEKVVREDPEQPFFAFISTKAPHEPFNPAPWYEGFWDESWPAHEPRPGPWNSSFESRKNHHGIVQTQSMLTTAASKVITDVFKNRWRTLMSVDDLIGDVIKLCERLGVADNTYFLYSSDHGFQLGLFNELWDKRHVYEWDTKIHLLARGPGITPGSAWNRPATQVDLAPTFLGFAGLDKPSTLDGHSLVPFLVTADNAKLSIATASHLKSLLPRSRYIKQWRDNIFFEYYFVNHDTPCVNDCDPLHTKMHEYPVVDSRCGDLTPNENAEC